MIFKAIVVLIGTLAMGALPDAAPWGAKGHRTVAQIGSRHLDDRARDSVARILGPGQLRLARAATWPDDVRSDTSWTRIQNWHFLTVEDTADFRMRIRPVAHVDSIDNVAQAIEFFSAILRDDKEKRQQFVEFMDSTKAPRYLGSVKATALALVVHFIGDIHQPLHVGRGPDLGGNRISVNWFGSPSNLHSVWDSGMIEQQDLSFTEIARIVDSAPDSVSRWQSDSLSTWVRESKDLRAQVYAFTEVPNLAYTYAFDNTETVNKRLLQGGVRLAAVLNSIFD